MASVSKIEFDLFRKYIEEISGISLGDDKAYLLETRLTKLMLENGAETFGEFYKIAKADNSKKLRDKIICAITTNETLWFRDIHPFKILEEKILPELEAEVANGKRSKIRIWSAASSTGQELYSVAMSILNYCKKSKVLTPDHFELLGTDISPSALFMAISGRYNRITISRGLPENLKKIYFKEENNTWTIDESIRQMTKFKNHNLLESPQTLGKFDVVFLRYVLIYFTPETKQQIIKNISKVLRAPGYFFLGAVEAMHNLSNDFDSLQHAGGTYFKKR